MTLRRPLSLPPRRPVSRWALEPRIVFDGAMPVAAAAAEHHEAPSAHAPAVERHPAAEANGDGPDATSRPADRRVAEAGARPITQRDGPATSPATRADDREIVFVDAAVADVEAYLPGFKGRIVTLDAGQDGLDQIAAALANETGLTAVHILSHGEAGVLFLGNTALDTAGITGSHAADLAAIKAALVPGADLLLYGCDVAAGATGEAFIEALAAATNADVAASTDETGAADKGGNWVLEASTGSIETRALDAVGWDRLLVPLTATNDSITTNEDSAITFDVRANDSDPGYATSQLTVTRINGTAITAGGYGIDVTGGVVTLDGSGNLTFRPNPNYNGSTSFTYTVTDPSLATSTATVSATITAVDDAPVLNLNSNTNLLVDGGFDNTQQTVVDGNNLKGQTYGVYTTNTGNINIIRVDGAGYADAPDVADTGNQYLDLAGSGYVQQSFTLATATAITFGGAFANRDAFLGDSGYDRTTSIQILNGSGTVVATAGAVTLTSANGEKAWFATTGSTTLAAGTYTYRVNLGDYAQVDSLYVHSGSSYATSYTENALPVAIASSSAAVTDVDNTTLTSATITLTNPVAGDYLSVIAALPSGIFTSGYNASTGVLALTGTATSAAYAMALADIGFGSTSDNPTSANRTINVTVSDGTLSSTTAVTTIAVTPVDDAPVVNLNSNTNLLIDGGFDNTQQTTVDGNNLKGMSYGAYTSNVPINIIRVDGTSYPLGPDYADTGNQYLDLSGSGYIQQTFTLSSATAVTFGGAFSNRDLSNGTYTPPTATIQILDSGGNVVATGGVSLTRVNGAEAWYASTGTATLAAGTYTYRLTMGDYAHADSLYVHAGSSFTTSYTENALPVAIASSSDAVTDPDNTTLTSATITLTNPVAGDYLSVIAALPSGITTTGYNTSTGVLTLTGSATSAAYATAIAGIGFGSTSDNPTNANRTINVTVSDGTLSSTTAVTTVAVTPVDDAPLVNLNSNANLLVDGGFDNTQQPSVDANNLQGMTYGAYTSNVAINIVRVDGTSYSEAPNLADSGNQYLDLAGDGYIQQSFTLASATSINFGGVFANRDSVYTGFYSPPTATIQILDGNGNVVATGSAVSLDVTNGKEAWYASTGSATLAAGTYTYRVTMGNFAQADSLYVRTGSSYTTSYTENALPVAIASSSDAVTDPDNATMTSATVTLINPVAGDYLSMIAALPSGITSTGYNASTGVLTLTGSATSAVYATAIANIGFGSTSDNPTSANRTINLTVSDGTLSSTTAVTTIAVTPVDDAPVVNLNSNANLLVDGGFDNTQQPNVDANNLQGTSYGAYTSSVPINIIRVDGTSYAQGPNFADSGNQYLDLAGAGSIQQTFTLASATSLTFGGAFANRGTAFAAFYTPPTVSIQILDSGGNVVATGSAVSLNYANGKEAWYASTGAATLAAGSYTYKVTMGDFAQADSLYVRAGSGYTTAYTENASPVAIASSADAVTDADNATLTSATITLTNPVAGDYLSVISTLPSGIAASPYDNTSHTIVLTGSATTAAYATAIAGIGFASTSDDPTNASRTISVTASDGVLSSTTSSTTINVIPVNDAPTSSAPTSVTSAEDTTLAFGGGNALTVADVDSPSLTVSLNVGHGTLTLGTTSGLTFSSGNGNANASMVFSGTQAQLDAALVSLSFRPGADYNGSDTLGFTTSDGSLTVTKSIALTITPVADIAADSVTTNENVAIAFNAITGTNGATADTFSDPGRAVTSVTQGGHGSVGFSANGMLTYTPNANFYGTDTFTYTVTAGGTTETATETVNVAFVDQAPASTAPTSVTSAEDTTLAFSGGNALTVADVDSPTLTVSLNVGHGTLTLGTITGLTFTTGNGNANAAMVFSGSQAQLNAALASLSFRPNPDYNGSDTLGFTTSDGSLTTTKAIALTITPVADITADNVTTNENVAIVFNAITGTNGATADTFSDASRAVTSVTQGNNGSVVFNANGTLTYTPNTNFSGTDTFTYTVTAGGTTETATETVTVGAVNQAPTTTAPSSVTSSEDTTIAFSGGNALSVFDVDSPTLTVSLAATHGALTLGTTTGLTFTIGNGAANTSMTFSGTQAQLNAALASLTFRPSPDYNGAARIGFATSDGSLTVSKIIALDITPVADITADNVTTNQNVAIAFNAITGTNGATADAFSDPGRAVTSVTQGGHGSVVFDANGTLTYTPNANFSGTDTFTYTVTAGGTTETATETVNVAFVDQAPTSTAPTSVTSAEDTTLTFNGGNALTVSDVDSALLTVSLNVGHGTLTLGTITGLTFTTGNGNANAAMVFSGTQAQLNAALASLRFRPNPDYNGSDTLGFTTSDGSLTTTKSIALTITPVADIAADSVTTNENVAIAFNAITGTNGATADTFSDPGRAVTSVTQGLHGSVVFNADGTLTYTPNAGFYGTDSYSYTVTAGGTTETAGVTMTVLQVNQAPVAGNVVFTAAEDAIATIDVRANATDPDGDPLTVTQVNGQALTVGGAGVAVTGGTITLGSGGNLVFTPTAYYRGPTSFTYTVADPSGATSTATVSGTITPINHVPVANGDTATIDEDHATSGNVLANDTDADGDALVLSAVNGSAANVGAAVAGSNGGLFTILSNGAYSFAANGQFDDLGAGQSRTTTASYTASDGHGGTATTTITLTVTGVNDAPVANADSFDTTDTQAAPGGIALSNNVLTNDTDAEHDPLTVSAVDGNAALVGTSVAGGYGTLTLNANGSFAYAVDRTSTAVLALLPGQTLTDQFTYTASDGHGGTSSTTLTIRVQGTNDGPIAGNDGNSMVQGQTVASGNVITGVRTDGGGTTTTVPSAIDSDPGYTLGVTAIRLPAENPGTTVSSAMTGSRTGQYGTLTIDAGGNYTYVLNNGSAAVRALVPGQSVTESFVYTVTDGAHTAEATLTVAIGGINDAPVAQNDSFTTAEGMSATINVRGNDSDPDHDPIRVTAIDGTPLTAGGAGVAVTGGTVTLNASGDLVYTPDTYYRGSPSFTYTIEDPSGAVATASVSGTVTPVNHAPTAVPDTFSTPQGTAATIDVRANDSDVDGDAIGVTRINGNAITAGGAGVVVNGGVVTLTSSGSLVFTPATSFNGPVAFTYTIADPSGATATAGLYGNVTHVNQAPSAAADAFVSPQNTTATIDVRANDRDPDGDQLTVTQVNGIAITAGGAAVAVTGGTVVLDTAGKLAFTPTANFRGSTSFNYTVSDPSGATSSATVSGTVTAVDQAPVAAGDSFAVTQGSVATIDARANDSDPDGDPLTITKINGTAITAGGAAVAVTGGSVALDGTGKLVFTPTAGFSGTTVFGYTLSDPSGATSTASIVGTVSPDHAPVANPDRFTTTINTPVIIDVRANDTDADNDPLTVTQINGASIVAGGAGIAVTGGTVTLVSSGALVFTPTANTRGATSFTYTVSDPAGATASATVSGAITTPGNHAPIAVGDAFTISVGTVAVVDVRANDADVDGDPLVVTQINGTAITTGAAGIAVTGGTVRLDASGNVVFTPTAGYVGATAFSYTVSDPSGTTSSASVNGTVVRSLHAPVAVPDTVTIAENAGPTILDVRGNDIDVDNAPLTITQINGVAIVAGGAGVAVAGGTVSLDGSGNLVFTPTANQNGPATFSYTIGDPSGSRSSATVSVGVTPGANAPVAVADTFTIAENAGATIIDVRGNDRAAAGPLTITQINGTAIRAGGPAIAVIGGSIALDAAGNLSFTPTANSNGAVSFSYTVSDPSGSSSTASVAVGVVPGAHAPVAMPDRVTIVENAAATVVPVLANDVDADHNALTITRIDGQPISAGGPGIVVAGGLLNLDVTGRLLFTPAANFNGPVNFTYTASDPAGSSSTAAVTLTVAPLDIGPVVRPDQGSKNGAVTIDVLANDSDASGTLDPLTVRLVGTTRSGDPLVIAGMGAFTIDRATGAITFTPVAGFVGTATAAYTVADSNGVRSAATSIAATITADRAPVANPDTFTVAQNAVATIDVLGNDTDADGDALTITRINGLPILVNGPAVAITGGSLTLDAVGLHFTPTPNSFGPVAFTYTVQDPSGMTSTATVSGSVTRGAVNAQPDVAFGESGAPIRIDVLGNDRSVAGDPLMVTAIDGRAIAVGGPGIAIAGGVVSLAADGTLLFVPSASNGSLATTSFVYTTTSQSGAVASAVVTLDLFAVTNPPLSHPSSFDNDASTRSFGATTSAPSGSPVLQSVVDTRNERAVVDPFGSSGFDADTIGPGLGDDLTFATGRIADTLFVQHAVRHEALPTTHALHVQHAVEESQREARLLDLRTSDRDDVTASFDPFGFDARVPLRVDTPMHSRPTDRHAAAPDTVPLHALTIEHAKPARSSGFSAQLRHQAEGLLGRTSSRGRSGAAPIERDPRPGDRSK